MMNKRVNRILITICATVVLVVVILLIAANIKGDDGLTYVERKTLEKNGEAAVKVVDEDEWQTGEYGQNPTHDANANGVGGKPNTEGNNKNESSSDKNTSGNTSSSTKPSGNGKMTYEKYINLSPEKQQKYFESFKSPKAFFDWFNAAKAEYENGNNSNKVEGGGIDIGDYMD